MHADDAVDIIRAANRLENVSDAVRVAGRAEDAVDVARAGKRLEEIEDISHLCSFSAATLVATANGERAIGTLREGDNVLAYNEALDATGIYTVTAIWVHVDEKLVHLTIDGEQLETTPGHPFYVRYYGWVEAGELHVGDRIRKVDGSYGVVQSVLVVHQPQPMYNLTVETAHTYFVGDLRWLVHNRCRKVKESLQAGEAGAYGDLIKRGKDTDEVVPHHMPQKALKHTSEEKGGALVLTDEEHALTRTFRGKGAVTAQQDKGKSFRDVLATDIQDVRSIAAEKRIAQLCFCKRSGCSLTG